MSLICSLNLSVGVYTTGDLFEVADKTIGGLFGPTMSKFVSSNKEEKNCRFVPVFGLGNRLSNGSFTGAKKMLVEKTIDFYLRAENVLLPKGEIFLFDISTPLYTENVHLGQYIDRPMPRNVDALGFVDHSKTMVRLMFAGFLMTSVFILLFQWAGSLSKSRAASGVRPSRLKTCLLHLSKLWSYYDSYPAGSRRLTKINLIFLFYLLFIQLLLDMLSSNIKTNEVVVDSRDILDSTTKLWKSKRFACWLPYERMVIMMKTFSPHKSESIYNLIKESDWNSELRQIMDGKRPPDRQLCDLTSLLTDFEELNKFDFTKTFFILNKSTLYIMLTYTSKSLSNNDKLIFENILFDYQLLQVHYIAKSLDDQLKEQLMERIIRHNEVGLYRKLYDELEAKTYGIFEENKRYTNVQSLKDDFIKVSNLEFDYFEKLFVYLLVGYLLLSAVFVLKTYFKFLIKFVIKKVKRLKMAIREYQIHLQLRLTFKLPVCKFN